MWCERSGNVLRVFRQRGGGPGSRLPERSTRGGERIGGTRKRRYVGRMEPRRGRRGAPIPLEHRVTSLGQTLSEDDHRTRSRIGVDRESPRRHPYRGRRSLSRRRLGPCRGRERLRRLVSPHRQRPEFDAFGPHAQSRGRHVWLEEGFLRIHRARGGQSLESGHGFTWQRNGLVRRHIAQLSRNGNLSGGSATGRKDGVEGIGTSEQSLLLAQGGAGSPRGGSCLQLRGPADVQRHGVGRPGHDPGPGAGAA